MYILFYIKSTKSGSSFIYCRLSHNKQVSEFSLGIEAVKITAAHKKICEAVRLKLHSIEAELITKGTLSAKQLKNCYVAQSQAKSLRECFESFLEHAKTREDIVQATYSKYVTTYKHVLRCFPDLLINQLDLSTIERFNDYLRAYCCLNVRNKNLLHLKMVVNYSITQGWCSVNPFTGVKFKKDKVIIEALSEYQVKKLQTVKLNESLSKLRDTFLFQCYTGLAYADLAKLTENDIDDRFIKIYRKKTKELSQIPLLDVTKELLKKYNNKLPVLSNQKMNSYLKTIATVCDININLTTHVARHTFATMLINNGVSIYSVAKILGHSNIKETQKYAKLAQLTIEQEVQSLNKKISIK